MSKYTNELTQVADRLNNAIKHTGTTIKISHRNGYTAIDKMSNRGMEDYVAAGLTDKQAIDYLHAMIKGLNLLNNSNL